MTGWLRRLFWGGELDCKEVKDLSSDYLEEDLSPSVRGRFQRHLESCDRCSILVATLRATILTLRNLPRRTAPADLRQRIQKRLEQEAHGPPPKR